VLFIGEAPGKEEDKTGLPFVGKSGDLLEYIIGETELTFSYGIMNVLACIPPEINKVTGKVGVRKPTPQEADACRPRFLETLYTANPELIVLLGQSAKKFARIPKELSDIPVLELYHPAYIARKGGKKSIECTRAILYLKETLEEIHAEKVQNN
jgi:DNA polymerase